MKEEKIYKQKNNTNSNMYPGDLKGLPDEFLISILQLNCRKMVKTHE